VGFQDATLKDVSVITPQKFTDLKLYIFRKYTTICFVVTAQFVQKLLFSECGLRISLLFNFSGRSVPLFADMTIGLRFWHEETKNVIKYMRRAIPY
jgi:hypothetical protein